MMGMFSYLYYVNFVQEVDVDYLVASIRTLSAEARAQICQHVCA